MTPKEKAKELVHKFYRYVPADEEHEHEYAKQCALIAVDEMIEWSKKWVDEEMITPALIYLENVKKEIEKL